MATSAEHVVNTIPITHVQQRRGDWCWAACCEMLAAHYDVTVTQESLAAQFQQKFKHVGSQMADAAEYAWVLRNYAHRHVDVETSRPDLGRPLQVGFDEIGARIGRNQLMIAGAVNHAWLIVGTGTTWGGTKFLWIHNPDSPTGPERVPWSEFRSKMDSLVTVSRCDLGTLD